LNAFEHSDDGTSDRADSGASRAVGSLPSQDAEASATLDALVRRGYGELVAKLVRVLGPARLQLAEDVVQEALLRALRHWPASGVPDDPHAWLLATARNLALDGLRKRRVGERVLQELAALAQERGVDALSSRRGASGDASGAASGSAGANGRASNASASDAAAALESPADDTLRLLFMCAHPALPEDVRLPLVLKTVCGFGNSAIAAALLSKEGTIAQKLTRAKARLEAERVVFELPAPERLAERLGGVLEVLRLVFNEGYRAHRGEDLVQLDLVHEALRLAKLLAEHPATAKPSVHAFIALVYFLGARLPARVDEAGDVLTLAQQDRALWDRRWIAAGFAHFSMSIAGPELTALHAEARIASLHAIAPDAPSTDWPAIRREYDRLLTLRDDPVVRLNRAVAVAKTDGPAAGLAALDELGDDGPLAAYSLRLATRAQFCWLLGRHADAEHALVGALALPSSAPERRLLERRLAAVRRGEAAPAW
jgi:RNA polymerase sigma-70 factor (ECF subfamily)